MTPTGCGRPTGTARAVPSACLLCVPLQERFRGCEVGVPLEPTWTDERVPVPCRPTCRPAPWTLLTRPRLRPHLDRDTVLLGGTGQPFGKLLERPEVAGLGVDFDRPERLQHVGRSDLSEAYAEALKAGLGTLETRTVGCNQFRRGRSNPGGSYHLSPQCTETGSTGLQPTVSGPAVTRRSLARACALPARCERRDSLAVER